MPCLFALCPPPKERQEVGQGAGRIAHKSQGGGNSSELAFSDCSFESCHMHFTYIANNFFAKDTWGTWDSVAEGQCPTAALAGALGWIWSITWEAAKPCRSRNTSTAFNTTIYSLKWRDFTGQGLTAQRLHLPHGEPCSRVTGCLLPACF